MIAIESIPRREISGAPGRSAAVGSDSSSAAAVAVAGGFGIGGTEPRTRQVTAGRVPLLQAVGRSLGVGAPPFDGAHPIRLTLAVDAVAVLQRYGYQRATNRRSRTGFLRAPVDVVYGDPRLRRDAGNRRCR